MVEYVDFAEYYFRNELQLLLERAGLAIVDIFRDYEKNAYDGTGKSLRWHAVRINRS